MKSFLNWTKSLSKVKARTDARDLVRFTHANYASLYELSATFVTLVAKNLTISVDVINLKKVYFSKVCCSALSLFTLLLYYLLK